MNASTYQTITVTALTPHVGAESAESICAGRSSPRR